MELRALCLVCVFSLTSGQFSSRTRHNAFQQTSQLSMPRRQLSSQHPDPRLTAQMGVAMQNRLSTRMPGNSLMPTTQVTMAPGIQRSRLGSPHHQPSTKPPPVSLLEFLLGTTPVPRESTPLSSSASPHRAAPLTMENFPRSPFRPIQRPSTNHAGQNRWSSGSGQTPFSQNQLITPNNGQNSNQFSSIAFRNPSTPRSSSSPRPGHTQTLSSNLLSSQPVQSQITAQTNNPSQIQTIMSSSNSQQTQQQFSSPRIGQPQPTQRPLVQHHWNPAGSPVQPHSSNSFQNSLVQQQLTPPGIGHSQTGQKNHDWKTQNSWKSQNQPSQNVDNTLKPGTPGRLESLVTRPTSFSPLNFHKNQPTGFQQHADHVKTLQPMPSSGFQHNPPYQNVAARRTEQRQFDPQYIESPQTSTTLAPIYNIKTYQELEPHQTSSSNSLSSRIDQQSSTNVIQNQPYSRPESIGMRQASERNHLSSLNIVRSLPATHTPWSQRQWQSSTNIHRTLPDTQPDTTRRKNTNTHNTSAKAARNLPSHQSAIPQRMETSSPNIVRTLPIDLQDSQQKRNQGRRTTSISVQSKPQGMRWKQNEVSNSPTTQPTSHTKTEKSPNLQITGSQPGFNKQQSGTLKQSPLVSNTNTNPLNTEQQPSSSTQKKTGLIPTVINGKKYMINPHFVDLLKGLLSKAGLDMKTDSSVTTVRNDLQGNNVRVADKKQGVQPFQSNGNRIAKVGSNHPTNRLSIDGKHNLPQTMLQPQSNYEPPVMKQRIDHSQASTPGINAVAYTNLGTIGQTKPEVVNNKVTRNSQNAQDTTQPNSPYQAIKMTSQPQSPFINTVQSSSRMTMFVTAAPKTETISFTNPISLMTKSPQIITTTTTPLPVMTPAPKRRKALLLPFRDVPNTTTSPVVATTLRQTSAPKSVPNQAATNSFNDKSVTPPPRNFLIGTTKSVGNNAQILTPRYLSDRRTTSTVTTMAPTTRLVMGKLTEPTNFHAMVTEPTGISTISYKALDTATISSPSMSKSILPKTFLNSGQSQTMNPPRDQLVQNNGLIEQVSEQTPLRTPDPTEIAVNVQFGFNLGHFRHNKSKKGANKHLNSDGSVINDVFSRSDGLSPSDGISVHKGFVGFNNKANNVELFVLR